MIPKRLTLRVDENGKPQFPELDGVRIEGVVELSVTQRVNELAEAVLTIRVGGVEFDGPASVDLREESPGG